MGFLQFRMAERSTAPDSSVILFSVFNWVNVLVSKWRRGFEFPSWQSCPTNNPHFFFYKKKTVLSAYEEFHVDNVSNNNGVYYRDI